MNLSLFKWIWLSIVGVAAVAGTQEIAVNIVGVDQTAGETGAASQRVLSASPSLAREAGTLRSVVETFLQGVRTA